MAMRKSPRAAEGGKAYSAKGAKTQSRVTQERKRDQARGMSVQRSYTVKSGDTLSGIAAKAKTTVANIYKLNPALAARKAKGGSVIFAGSKVKLPKVSVNATRNPKGSQGPRSRMK